MKRTFWKILFPFLYILNKLGLVSYGYRNKGLAAWRKDRFNPIVHFQYFGDSIEVMPTFVTLCAIGYNVRVSEGLVLFTEEMSIASSSRISFERDPYEKCSDLWYVECKGHIPASHVVTAYDWVKAVYGGSFEYKRAPLRESQNG